MTTKFKQLLALLVLLGSGTGTALADRPDYAQAAVAAVTAAAPGTSKPADLQAPRQLAWQRVGAPIREA